MLPDYEVACEHEHSNCVLIAHKKVKNATMFYVFTIRPIIIVMMLLLCSIKLMGDGILG